MNCEWDVHFLYKLSCSHELQSLVHDSALLISQQSLRRQLTTFFAAALFLCYASKLMLMHKASVDANSFPAGVLM